MTWKDVGTVVAKAAPVLGAVVGGPVGVIAGAAGSLIASALGCEPTPEAVQAAVATSPDAGVRLREVEAAERGRLLDWQAEQLRAELANTQDARAREVSMVQAGAGFAAWGPPAAISLVVVAGFFAVLWAVMSVPKVGEPLLLLLGSLSAAFGGVVNYYLGSSLGSSQKTAMLTGAKDAAR